MNERGQAEMERARAGARRAGFVGVARQRWMRNGRGRNRRQEKKSAPGSTLVRQLIGEAQTCYCLSEAGAVTIW
jgi:hypothetical protein